MAKLEPTLVDKPELARELGITVRRVNQLLIERVLPPPNAKGLHDLDLAQERFDLFRDPSTDWEHFLTRDLAELTEASERAMKRLERPGATLDDARGASLAAQAAAVGLRFFVACKMPAALREMHHRMHDQQEDAALGAIWNRTAEIVAGQEGATPEAVHARWRAELAEAA